MRGENWERERERMRRPIQEITMQLPEMKLGKATGPSRIATEPYKKNNNNNEGMQGLTSLEFQK